MVPRSHVAQPRGPRQARFWLVGVEVPSAVLSTSDSEESLLLSMVAGDRDDRSSAITDPTEPMTCSLPAAPPS
jgi:hypothetical protein